MNEQIQAKRNQAAHPWRAVSSLVYDLESGKKLALADVFTAQDELYNLMSDGVFTTEWMEAEEIRSKFSLEEILRAKDNLGEWFYLNEDGIGIVIDMPHAVGDYWEFEASYADISDYLTVDFINLLLLG